VLKEVETFGGLAVACVLVAAIELTIEWNGISADVNHVTTAAQLIPLGIVIALILVFLYDLKSGDPEGGSSSSGSSGSHTSSSSGGGSGSSTGISSSLAASSSDPSSSSSGPVRYSRSVVTKV
jgi:uncharacterized membrane protein YgcG